MQYEGVYRMFQAGVKKKFLARHFLRGDFDEETVAHSHDYLVYWRVATEDLDENGFSVDIALMEELLEGFLAEHKEKLLNDLPFFHNRQASVENTALYLHRKLSEGLEQHGVDPKPFIEMEVTIWESEEAWASYTE
jgi:6-pyruvoyl-tetrahydropterin synthase